MEYVDGETLTERLRNQPDYFNRHNTEKLLRQLLDALQYLHAHQVVHLDLKPDNILLTRINSDVKIVDLGFCLTDAFADTQGRTPAYAAPEQLSGGDVDVRTDIYAVGCIIKQMPLHQQYNKVIARCTAENPADRYQSVADLQRALAPERKYWLWAVPLMLIVLSLAYFLSAGKESTPSVESEPQEDTMSAQQEPVQEIPAIQPAQTGKSEGPRVKQTNPPALGSVKSTPSEEENEFLS